MRFKIFIALAFVCGTWGVSLFRSQALPQITAMIRPRLILITLEAFRILHPQTKARVGKEREIQVMAELKLVVLSEMAVEAKEVPVLEARV